MISIASLNEGSRHKVASHLPRLVPKVTERYLLGLHLQQTFSTNMLFLAGYKSALMSEETNYTLPLALWWLDFFFGTTDHTIQASSVFACSY